MVREPLRRLFGSDFRVGMITPHERMIGSARITTSSDAEVTPKTEYVFFHGFAVNRRCPTTIMTRAAIKAVPCVAGSSLLACKGSQAGPQRCCFLHGGPDRGIRKRSKFPTSTSTPQIVPRCCTCNARGTWEPAGRFTFGVVRRLAHGASECSDICPQFRSHGFACPPRTREPESINSLSSISRIIG